MSISGEEKSPHVQRSFVGSGQKRQPFIYLGWPIRAVRVIQKQKSLCKELLDWFTYWQRSWAILGHSFRKPYITPTGSFVWVTRDQKIHGTSKAFSLASTIEFIWSNGKTEPKNTRPESTGHRVIPPVCHTYTTLTISESTSKTPSQKRKNVKGKGNEPSKTIQRSIKSSSPFTEFL